MVWSLFWAFKYMSITSFSLKPYWSTKAFIILLISSLVFSFCLLLVSFSMINVIKVVKNNKEIFLSKVEYRILVILAQDIGIIKGSKEILKELWDTDYDIPNYENTLSVYIKRLREKIEDDPSNPVIIQTIRKKGYVINEK